MTGRSIATIVTASAAILGGMFVLAAVGIVGWFFVALAFPEKMDVAGRVTDIAGTPIKGVTVQAIPLPIPDPYSDGLVRTMGKERTAVTAVNGSYRLVGLIASGGVKEGMWVQDYDLAARADGYVSRTIRVRRPPEAKQDTITGIDFVLERESHTASASPDGSS